MKYRILLTVALMFVFVTTSFAIMGPPTATLNQGQLEVGFDYSRFDMENLSGTQSQSNAGLILAEDVYIDTLSTWEITKKKIGKWSIPWLELGETDIYGDRIERYGDSTVGKFNGKGFSTSLSFARIGYGLTDDIELFARHGTAELELGGEFEPASSYAVGVGTKINLYKHEKLTVGVVGQWHLYSWEESLDGQPLQDECWDTLATTGGTWNADYSEWKFAVGPALELTDWCTVYGGPYYSVIAGTLESETNYYGEYSPDSGGKVTLEGSEKSKTKFEKEEFGAAAGLQFVLSTQLRINLEGQVTSDTNLLGASASYRF